MVDSARARGRLETWLCDGARARGSRDRVGTSLTNLKTSLHTQYLYD